MGGFATIPEVPTAEDSTLDTDRYSSQMLQQFFAPKYSY